MRSTLAAGLLLLAFVALAPAQDGPRYLPPRRPVPNLNGTWFLNGDTRKPCEIIQYLPGRRAEFTNENGSTAWGTIRGDSVWIPDWSDGVSQGLMGRVRGNRIIWPNGSYWSR